MSRDNGNLLTVEMGDLRDIHGAGRLGIHVRSSIHRALENAGLGHYPIDLPDYQSGQVRVYRLGSDIADLIAAVTTPSSENDDALRSVSGGEAAEMIRRIKELVCD